MARGATVQMRRNIKLYTPYYYIIIWRMLVYSVYYPLASFKLSPLPPRSMPPVLSTLSDTHAQADTHFRNDLSRPHLAFFKALARSMGGDNAEKALALSALIVNRFCRTTMGQLGQLTRGQLNGLLTEVGADVCWRETIEDFTGLHFEHLDQSVVIPTAGNGEQIRILCNTVSDQLGEYRVTCVWLPSAVWVNVHAVDEANTVLSPAQVSAIVLATCVWVFCKTGQFNIGTGLARHLAQQIPFRQKLEAREMRKEIDWTRILLQKMYTLNRKDAIVRATRTPCPSLTTSTLLPPAPPAPLRCALVCSHLFAYATELPTDETDRAPSRPLP